MNEMNIMEREMTPGEFARMNAGFDEHALAHGVKVQDSERLGFVALDGGAFIGCVSGLAYKNGEAYSGWFYLTDLYVEEPYRRRGLGTVLLTLLEDRIGTLGIRNIWTWTAGYDGPAFYQKLGYEIFVEMEGWFSDGSSHVGLRKNLKQESP